MQRKGAVVLLILSLIVILFLVMNTSLKAQEKPSSEDKLSQILDGQREILQQLSAMKEQLERIEIRANKL